MTASELYVVGLFGMTPPAGPAHCFLCGASCAESLAVSEYVRDTFTDFSGVACPGSSRVCLGCAGTLVGFHDVTLIDGERRTGQKIRNYSWVLTTSAAKAATKAHLEQLRHVCLHPPEPPYAIVLADSGQRQLIYRARVVLDDAIACANLEGEAIEYQPAELRERLDLVGRLVAVSGKPALLEPVNWRLAEAVIAAYPSYGESLLAEWREYQTTPLSRLAVWLSPNREQAASVYLRQAP